VKFFVISFTLNYLVLSTLNSNQDDISKSCLLLKVRQFLKSIIWCLVCTFYA